MNPYWWTLSRRRTRRASVTGRPKTCLQVEDLEIRIAPAIKATFVLGTGTLSVTTTKADTIRLTIDNGAVLVNGVAPTGGPAAGDIQRLNIKGSAGADIIDLSGLPAGSLPGLQNTSIVAGGGSDSLIAPDQDNSWLLTGLNAGNLNGTIGVNSLVGGYNFAGIERLVGGTGADTFRYQSKSAGVSGGIGSGVGPTTIHASGDLTLRAPLVANGPVTIDVGGDFTLPATSRIETLAIGGMPGGGVTINADSATVDGPIATNGGPLSVDADDITVGTHKSVTISTRQVADGADPATAASIGNSGDVQFSGETIRLGALPKFRASLFAQAEAPTGFHSGAVLMTVFELAGTDAIIPGLVKVFDSDASIRLDQATIQGGDVTLSAKAENSQILSDQPDENLAQHYFDNTLELVDVMGGFGLIGGVAVTHASAEVNVGTATTISAASVTATAVANTDASAAPLNLPGGVAVAIAGTDAHVTVAGQVTTTGSALFRSGTETTVDARADSGALIPGTVGCVAVTVLNADTTTVVTPSARLNVGGDLGVRADSVAHNVTLARTFTGSDDGRVGISVAVSDMNVDTTAQMDGQASVGGDLTVIAQHNKTPLPASRLGLLPTYLNGVTAQAGVNTDSTGELLKDDQNFLITKFISNNVKGVLGGLSSGLIAKIKGGGGGGESKVLGMVKKFPGITKLTGLISGGSDAAGGSGKLGKALKPVKGFLKGVGDSNLGAAVVVALEDNQAEARIGDGVNPRSVSADGAVTVNGQVNARPAAVASSLMQEKTADPTGAQPKTAFAGSVAIVFDMFSNSADAYINRAAKVDAGKTLTVQSDARNDYQVSYGANLTGALAKQPDYTTQDGTATIDNGTIVEVEDGHTAGGTPGDWYKYVGPAVGSAVDLSTQDYSDTNNWEDLGAAADVHKDGFLRNVTTFLNNNFGAATNATDTWSQATAKGGDVSIAGSATVLLLGSESHAFIAPNAQVNQNPALRTGTQVVVVQALGVNDGVNVGGNLQTPGIQGSTKSWHPSIQSPGLGSDSADDGSAVGAGLLVLFFNNDTAAHVDDGARVYGDSVNVDAETRTTSVAITASGGQSDNAGFNGAVTLVKLSAVTLAQIASGASVQVWSAPIGVGGPSLAVTATDTTNMVNVTGGVLVGEGVGFGASVGGGLIDRTTEAVIGDAASDKASPRPAVVGATVTSAGPVDLAATNDGFLGQYSLAAAVIKEETQAEPASAQSTSPVIGAHRLPTQATGSGAEEEGGQFGMGVSANVSVNLVTDTTLAHATRAALVAPAADVEARDQTAVQAFSGSAAVTTSDDGASAALAGAFSFNGIFGGTRALVEDSRLDLTGDLTVAAEADMDILSVSASGAVARAAKGFALAGQVSVNTINSVTEAMIRQGSDVAADDTAVTATNDSGIVAVSGALAYGGRAGVGASIALNTIPFFGQDQATRATVENSTIDATGNLTVKAEAKESIKTIGAAIGASKEGMAGALTFSINNVNPDVEAIVDNPDTGPGVTAGGDLDVSADDASTIAALAGGAAVTAGAAGLGLAFSLNLIDTTVAASLRAGAAPIVARSTRVRSRSAPSIDLGAVAGGIAVPGEGEGSGPSVGAGAAVAVNDITGHTEATIDGAAVQTTAGVELSAVTDARVDGLVIGLGGSVGNSEEGGISLTGAGAGVAGEIDVTTEAVIRPNSKVTAGGPVTLSAHDASIIVTDAGGFALAASTQGSALSVGASVGVNQITDTVRAIIDNAKVTADSVSLDADSTAVISALTLAGSVSVAGGDAGIAFGGAGAGSGNTVTHIVEALITDGANVSATGGDVSLTADDHAVITANAGALGVAVSGGEGGGTGAIGASVAENTITGRATAAVDASTVSSAGAVALSADAGATAVAVTVGASGAVSTGEGGGLSLSGAGSASVNTIDNTSEAVIRNKSTVTAIGAVTQAADDTSTVTAGAGALALGISVGTGGGVAASLGASVATNQITDTVTATADNSHLTAGSVDQSADVTATIVAVTAAGAVAAAGGESGGFALSGAGAASANTIANTVHSGAVSGSVVTTTTGGFASSAKDTSNINADAGALAAAGAGGEGGGAAGAGGAAVAVNTIDNDVRALVDHASVTSAGNLDLTAKSNATIVAVTVGVSGALAGGQGGGIAVSLAGSLSFNSITNTTEAAVRDTTTATAVGALNLKADDDSLVTAAGGAGAIAVGAGEGGGAAVAAGASVAVNSIGNTIRAVVERAATHAGSANVTAGSDAIIVAVTTVGAAGGAGGQGGGIALAGAGAVSTNSIHNTVEARVIGQGPLTTDANGAVVLAADDGSTISANAGAVAFAVAGGQAGGVSLAVGGSVAINTIGNTVESGVDSATVRAGGGLTTTAKNDSDIVAVTVGLSGAVAGGEGGGIALSGAGSLSVNQITNTTEAAIRNTTTVSAGGALTLKADDDSGIKAAGGVGAIAGAGGQGGGIAGALAGSAAANGITNTVRAVIENATVTANSASLSAGADANIIAVTTAGSIGIAGGQAGGFALALAGAASGNTIHNTVEATVTGNGSLTTTIGGVTLGASDDSSIDANAGALTVAGAGGEGGGIAGAAGASVAVNLIGNAVRAVVDGATVHSAGGLAATAAADANILSVTVGAAGAGAFGQGGGIAVGAAGSISVNEIANTVEAAVRNTQSVTASGALDLEANDDSKIHAVAGSAAIAIAGGQGGGVAAGVAASIASNEIGNTVRANIDHATITAGGATLSADADADIIAVTSAGSVGGSGGQVGGLSLAGAGAGSGNTIHNIVEATVTGGGSLTTGASQGVTLTAHDDSGIQADAGALVGAGAGGQGGGGALAAGAGVAVNTIGNTLRAIVDGSTVHAGGPLSVTTDSHANILAVTVGTAIAGAGGQGGGVAITGAGSVSVNTITNTSEALIQNTNSVTAGGQLTLTAGDDSTIRAAGGAGALSIAGGQGAGISVALGGSVAANQIGNTVRASIDNAQVTAGGANMGANSGATILAVTTAGVTAIGGAQFVGIGLAGAGAGSGNQIENVVTATVTNGGRLTTGQSANLSANDSSDISANAGAVAISGVLGLTGGGLAGAAGAAVAENTISNTIRAAVDGGTIAAGGDVGVTADSSGHIFALTLGLAGSLAGGIGGGIALDGAGSGSGNDITNTVEAIVVNGSTVTGANVGVHTKDESGITSAAGAAALAIAVNGFVGGAGAIGLSVVGNNIGNTVRALIDGTSVTATGNLAVTADTDARIVVSATGGAAAVSVGGGVGLALAGAGAETTNTIHNTTVAQIVNTTSVTSGGQLDIHAADDSDITAAATAGTIAVRGGGIGVAVSLGTATALNDIHNTVTSGLDHATVHAGGGANVTSGSDSSIDVGAAAASLAASIALGGAASGGGAEARNAIGNTITASVQNGSDLEAGGPVAIKATDDSDVSALIDANSITVGLVGAAVALSLTQNDVNNDVTAAVTDSTAAAVGDLAVAAKADQSIDAKTISTAVSVALGVAGAASDARTSVGGTVQAIARDAQLSAAGGDVKVNADSNQSASTLAIGISAGLGALSGLQPHAEVSGTTRASVSGTVNIPTGNLVVTANGGASASSNAVAVTIAGLGASGVHPTADTVRTTEAFIGSNSTVNVPTGTVTVGSTANSSADADTTGAEAVVIGLFGILTDATAGGETRAYIGDGSTLTARSVAVTADGTTNSSTTPDLIGIGVFQGSLLKANATTDSTTEAYIGQPAGSGGTAAPTRITATAGGASVHANSTSDAEATTRRASGGVIDVGALVATSEVDGTTRAYVGSDLTVRGDGLDVAATSDNSGTATAQFASIAAATLNGADVEGDTDVTTEAYIAPNVHLDAGTGAVTLAATSKSDSGADAAGLAGGFVALGALVTDAHTGGQTRADVGAGSTVTAGSLAVAANAPIQSTENETDYVGIGIVSGAVAISKGLTDGLVEAFVDAGAQLHISGDVSVTADSQAAPAVDILVGAGGILAAAGAASHATSAGTTQAFLADGVVVDNASDPTDNLTVRAQTADTASNRATIGVAGGLAGAGTSTDTTVESTVQAYLGAVRVNVANDVTVDATSLRAEGQALARALGAGGLEVGVPQSDVTINPTIASTIRPGATLTVGGDVAVTANGKADPAQQFDDFIHGVDTTQDAITFPSHGQTDGDPVVYSAGSGAPIGTANGTLTDGRTYHAVVVNRDTIRLGEQFASAPTDAGAAGPNGEGIDPTRDVIKFSSPHAFQSGDPVRFDTRGGDGLFAGFDPDTTYFVRVMDPWSIQLTLTAAAATAAAYQFGTGAVSGNTLNLPGHGFQNGDAVTYDDGGTTFFAAPAVDTATEPLTGNPKFNDDGEPEDDPNANTIYLPGNQFHTHDRIIYHTSGTPIGGLVEGQSYYVAVISPDVIQLSDSSSGASIVTDPFTNVRHAADPLPLDPSIQGALAARHALERPDIGGLTDGVTYYVTNAQPNSFQLSAAPGGPAIGLDTSGAYGTHSIGPAGLELTPTGGTQDVHIDLTSRGSGGDRLLAPGGISLRVDAPPVGSGQSVASARGGSIAVAGFDFPDATLTATPTVTAAMAGTVNAAGDVWVLANQVSRTLATADVSGGGFVSVQNSESDTRVTPTTRAIVGALSGSDIIGGGANIQAGGAFALDATADVQTQSTASSRGVKGLGDMESDADARIGNGGPAQTAAIVGPGAIVDGQTVEVFAHATQMHAEGDATTRSYGFFASADADSTGRVDSVVSTDIRPGATLTGRAGVDLRARQDEVRAHASSSATNVSLGFPFTDDPEHEGGNLTTQVITGDGALIAAGPRAANGPLTQVEGFDRLALNVEAANGSVDGDNIDQSRQSLWDADINVWGGVAPVLVVDAAGNIVQAQNASVTDNGVTKTTGHIDGPTVNVNVVPSPDAGQVLFQAANRIGQTAADPLFAFADSFDRVRIVNESGKDLRVGDINASGIGSTPLVSLQGGSIDLDFDIARTARSTDIEIVNAGTGGPTSSVILTGDIENPIGNTQIVNERGPILSAGPQQVLRTNTADIAATTDVGSAASRLNIELVQSLDRGLRLSDPADDAIRQTGLTVDARDGSAYLALTGRRRDGGNGPFTVDVDRITAGTDANVLLRGSFVDGPALGQGGPVEVKTSDGVDDLFFAHFRPDLDPLPDQPLDSGAFGNMANAVAVASTFQFRDRGTPGGPGLAAGNNIIVSGADNSPGATPVNLVADTDLTGSTGHVDATVNGDITLTEVAGAMRVGTVESTTGNVLIRVPDQSTAGQDLIVLANGAVRAAQAARLEVGDVFTSQAGSALVAGTTLTILPDFGNADPGVGGTVDVFGSISAPATFITGEADDDTINLNNVGGINQGLAVALITVDGQGGNDRLKVDDSASSIGKTGELTDETITGLGMGGDGIRYLDVQDVAVWLSQGGDEFVVRSTHLGTATAVQGDGGDDQVSVGATLAEDPTTPATLDTILGPLTVIGGAGLDHLYMNDRGYVDDQGLPVKTDYRVSPTAVLTGLATPRPFAGVTYDGSLEQLRLDGTDDVNIFDVKPSVDTEYTLDGNLPPNNCIVGGGDYLRLDTTGTTGRKLHILAPQSGNGYWDFTSPHKRVNFLSMERFNHTDLVAVVTGTRVTVKDAETGIIKFVVQPYEATFTGGVRYAFGDLNCDGLPDLIVAPGPGRLGEVKIYDGTPNALGNYQATLLKTFTALPANVRTGLRVAVGDVNGDGHNDLVTSADAGWVPLVNVWDGETVLTTPTALVPAFQAYAATYRGGVRIAVGDLDGDNRAEIITAPGVGTAPLLKVFSFDGTGLTLRRSFNGLPANMIKTGVWVAIGDYNGDGTRDVIVSPGAGGQPLVDIYSGIGLLDRTGTAEQPSWTFQAAAKTYRGGVRVVPVPKDGGNPGFVEPVDLRYELGAK